MNFKYVWEIKNSPLNSLCLSGNKIFSNQIFLIDHFSGKHPYFSDPKNKGQEYTYQVFKLCWLDSNLASSLHQFVTMKNNDNAFFDFLKFLTKEKWGISLHFYFMEALSKAIYKGIINHNTEDELKIFRQYATEYEISRLKIYLMDEEKFLRTGSIIQSGNINRIGDYLNDFNSVEECAADHVENFINSQRKIHETINKSIDIIEILIIKMVLIKHFEYPNASVTKQIEMFDNFMQQEFGLIFAREYCLAAHYFTNQSGKLLGIQRNSNFNKACSNIKSTSWDLFFLRTIDWSFLVEGYSESIDLGYLATKEKRLFDLATLFQYESIFISEKNTPIPIFQIPNITNHEQVKKSYPISTENKTILLRQMYDVLKFYLNSSI